MTTKCREIKYVKETICLILYEKRPASIEWKLKLKASLKNNNIEDDNVFSYENHIHITLHFQPVPIPFIFSFRILCVLFLFPLVFQSAMSQKMFHLSIKHIYEMLLLCLYRVCIISCQC